jgi:hypothetical protein
MTTLRYFQAKSAPPTVVTLAALSRGRAAVPTYFARIEGDALYDTGMSFQYYALGIPVSRSHYGLLKLGDRLLLVYANGSLDETAVELTGSIYPIDAETQRDIIDHLIDVAPELGDVLLPYVLDTADVRHAQWYFGAAALAAAAVIGSILFIPALQRLIDPRQDPTWRKLSNYGQDTDSIVAEVERDTQHGWRAGLATLGNQWIMSPGRHFTAIKLDEIAWVYKHTDTENFNGIPTVIRHQAVIWDRHGTKMTITADETSINGLVQRLHNRVPWAAAGYSSEIQRLWNKQRASFLEQISARKRDIHAE